MEATAKTAKKTRTITLTDRRPARIVEEDWPILAKAQDDSYHGNDYCRRQQALAQGELDRYSLIVREHEDGRVLVYAVIHGATAWTGTRDYRGGEMLDDEADVVAAIRRVGGTAVGRGMPERLIDECIGDLPAEEV